MPKLEIQYGIEYSFDKPAKPNFQKFIYGQRYYKDTETVQVTPGIVYCKSSKDAQKLAECWTKENKKTYEYWIYNEEDYITMPAI